MLNGFKLSWLLARELLDRILYSYIEMGGVEKGRREEQKEDTVSTHDAQTSVMQYARTQFASRGHEREKT